MIGDKVKPKNHTSKGASVPTIAIFAMLGHLLDRRSSDPYSPRHSTSLLAIFVAMFAAASFACAPALAGELYPPGPGSLFGGEGSGNGQFIEPAGVAVNDTTEDVYVVDKGNNRVEYFSSAGVYAGQFDGSATPAASFSQPHDIAVDDSGKSALEDPSVGDVYVVDNGHSVIDRFSATGEYRGQLTGTCASGPCTGEEAFASGIVGGVAVDRSGNVWVGMGFPGVVYEFTDSGQFAREYKTGRAARPGGMAVDSSGDVYVISGAETVLKFNPGRGEKVAEFDEGVEALALNPSTSNLLVDRGGAIDLYEPFAEPHEQPIETFPSEGLAESDGIAVSAAGTVYASERTADEVEIFNAVHVPGARTESASQVGETGETLHGKVNPEGKALTACRFEYSVYGTEAGVYQHTVACQQTPAEIGNGTAGVSVSAEVSGLQPGSTYHYRLTGANANGAGHGGDATFAVSSSFASALTLPDNRAYELASTIANTEVDPPNEGQPVSFELELGELLGSTNSYRAAADGAAVTYVGGTPSSGMGGNGVSHNTSGTHYLAMRTVEGWQADAIEPAPSGVIMTGFSTDLSVQIFTDTFEPGDSMSHSEFGAPSDCERGTVIDSRTGGVGTPVYSALFTTTKAPNECEGATPAGTSADDAHILFQSQGAYTSQATKGARAGENNLYDSVGGVPHQVNILPDGEPEPSPDAIFGGLTGEQQEPFNFGNDVSANGSRVFWTALEVTGFLYGEPVYRVKALYVRVNDAQPQSRVEGGHCTEPAKACTILVSEGGQYWTATLDGRYVLYTESGGLWRFDTSAGTREAVAAEGLEHENAGVRGVIGSSEDGSYVYFVAAGLLAENENAGGEKAQPQTCEPGGAEGPKGGTSCNLYVRHEGATAFITKLSSSASDDNLFVGSQPGYSSSSVAGDWRVDPGWRTAEVSPDGHAVAFMSRLALTGYDNKNPNLGGSSEQTEGLPEVFVYEAGTGQLSCASCNHAGAPPARTVEEWEEERGGFVSISTSSVFMPRWIGDAHGIQVYFNTSQPLVPRDSNHRQDVYEWESDGTGGCVQPRGCVNLLSGGDGPYDAYFVDGSVSGEDVFFTSREQLLPRALGETPKLFDARVNGGFPETSLACTGTGCQGVPPASPIFAIPSSLTFNGTGNFPPPAQPVVKPKPKPKSKSKSKSKCKRGFVRKHSGCVKRRGVRKTGPAKKANNHRRASR